VRVPQLIAALSTTGITALSEEAGVESDDALEARRADSDGGPPSN